MLMQEHRSECARNNNGPAGSTLGIGISGVSDRKGKKRKQRGTVEKQRKRVPFAPIVCLHQDLPTVTVNAKDIMDMPAMSHWRTPQKFWPSLIWLVANGSESLEVAIQQQRELGQLDAVYPHLASIPPSPAEPLEMSEVCDDSLTFEIPLIPVENEKEDGEVEDQKEIGVDDARDTVNMLSTDDSYGMADADIANQQESGVDDARDTINKSSTDDLYGVADADIAKAVATALMLVEDPAVSSLVDQELLIKLLRHPSLVEKLVSTCDTPTVQPKINHNFILSSDKQSPLEVEESRKAFSYMDKMPLENNDHWDMGFQSATVSTRSNSILPSNKQQMPLDVREGRKTLLHGDKVACEKSEQCDMGFQPVTFQQTLRATDREMLGRPPPNFNIGRSFSSFGGYIDFPHVSTPQLPLSSSSEGGPCYKTDNQISTLFSVGKESYPLELLEHDDLPSVPMNSGNTFSPNPTICNWQPFVGKSSSHACKGGDCLRLSHC